MSPFILDTFLNLDPLYIDQFVFIVEDHARFGKVGREERLPARA